MNFKQFLIENELEFKNAYDAYRYALIHEKRIPEAEEYLLKLKDIYWGLYYARDLIKGRWPEYEKLLLKSQNFAYYYYYTHDIIKERWNQAEEIICKNYEFTNRYCAFLKIPIKDFQEQLIQRSPFIIHKISRLDPDLAKKYHHLLVNKDVGIL